MNATNIFSPKDRERIEQAIARAEAQSSAEVVCAVASESGRYDRAESVIGLAGSLLGLAIAHSIPNWTSSATWRDGLHLGWQTFAVVAGFILGNILARWLPVLRRLTASEEQLEGEVRQAAAHAFLLGGITNTTDRTGLLIYVSLFERRIVILADETVHKSLGDEEISRLRDIGVSALKRRDFPAAFIDTVESVAPRLAETLPADRQRNPDQLSNHLLLFHPRPGT